MKELLIYGALVASIIAASMPVITSLRTTATTRGAEINTQITAKLDKLVSDVKSA